MPDFMERIALYCCRNEAERRARDILLSHLSVEQIRRLKEEGWFAVRGSEGGSYRIHIGTNGNVHRHGVFGRMNARLCFQPSEYGMPVLDVMLAQKLALEAAEDIVLRVACLSPTP